MISAARAAAFDILKAVERGHAHADDLLRGEKVERLSHADRNLATALVLGVLRWQIWLDSEIQAHLTRPNAKLDAEIRIALRLGVFQLRFMDRIPARAAIDESVELAKRAGHTFAARMVNAVLRKLSAASRVELPETTPAEVALAQAHPAWMVERWARFYGMDKARAICQHGQHQAALSIRFGDQAVERELASAGIEPATGKLLTAARVVNSGDLTAAAALRDGRMQIQDEGSQLVAEIGARALSAPARILDACAAPGGKTLILAERNPMAKIVACEASELRMERLRDRLAPLGDRVEFRLGDAAELADAHAFDAALVDVPCSGTGTLGRNPEIRHRLRPEDLVRHAERQKAILLAALQAVRRGGRVTYSTCSLEPEENEQVIAAVLREQPGVRVVPMNERIAAMQAENILADGAQAKLEACVTPEGFLRLLPDVFQTDGFFVALLEKIS